MGDFQCSWLADFFETFITLWKIFTVRYICHLVGHRCNCQGMFFVFLNSDCCQLFVIALCYGCLPCRWKFLCPDHIFNCQCVWFALLYLGNFFFKHIRGMHPVKSDKVSSTSWGGLLKFPTVLSSFNWVIVPCIVTVSYSLWSLRTSCIEMGCQLWIMETVFSHLWCSHFGHVVYNNFLAILCLGIVDKFFGVLPLGLCFKKVFFEGE